MANSQIPVRIMPFIRLMVTLLPDHECTNQACTESALCKH